MSLYAEFKELTTISEMSCSIKEVSCDLEPLKQHTEFLGYFNSKKKCTCLLLKFFVTQNTLLESKSVKVCSVNWSEVFVVYQNAFTFFTAASGLLQLLLQK